jgi:hypothetical protein
MKMTDALKTLLNGNDMKNLLKRLFCKHNYEKIGFTQHYDFYKNIRYPIRLYRCTKCGDEIKVDGRYDRYES